MRKNSLLKFVDVGNKSFNAHCAVLVSHFEVFEEMFEINKEREGRVIISDIDAQVMSDILVFQCQYESTY